MVVVTVIEKPTLPACTLWGLNSRLPYFVLNGSGTVYKRTTNVSAGEHKRAPRKNYPQGRKIMACFNRMMITFLRVKNLSDSSPLTFRVDRVKNEHRQRSEKHPHPLDFSRQNTIEARVADTYIARGGWLRSGHRNQHHTRQH